MSTVSGAFRLLSLFLPIPPELPDRPILFVVCRGRNSKIALFVGIALAAYIYSLDGTTTWQYQFYATSDFALHSLLGAIGTAQAIVLAVTKPFAAKFADVFGRAEAFCLAVFFYCLGYICIAACKDIHTYAAGAIIYYVSPLYRPPRRCRP